VRYNIFGDIKTIMGLPVPYYYLIAAASYLWLYIPLVANFIFEMSSLEWTEKKAFEDRIGFWLASSIYQIWMLLLQAIRALVFALPANLSQESVLCFEQGITLFMIFYAWAMHMQIFYSKLERTTAIYIFNGVQMCLLFFFGITMNILTYYGLKEDRNATRVAA
jgi:hypothetical protein